MQAVVVDSCDIDVGNEPSLNLEEMIDAQDADATVQGLDVKNESSDAFSCI